MSRWFRFYDDTINDPKILKLSDKLYRVWVGLLCITSKSGGTLPPFDDLALMLRLHPDKLQPLLEALIVAGLFDHTDDGIRPHNWDFRQFKSDTSSDRVKRYRERKCNVTVTSPDTDNRIQIQKDTEAIASDAAASDPRTRLFKEGLAKLSALTGKGPDACRSFVGKCLKAANDDAIVVLGLIEEAERNRVVDPSAWIAARLKGPENGRSKIIQAADDLRRKIASFDGPPSGDRPIRGGPGAASPRLLSNG